MFNYIDKERKKVQQKTIELINKNIELEINNQLLRETNIEITENQKQLAQALTELKKKEEIIKNLAYHDTVTNLPNRRFGKELLQSAIDNACKNKYMVGVMFIDLDKFKYANDTFGHDAGDQLLITVAKRLKNSIREKDSVARIGGDEFMIILDQLSSLNDLSYIPDKILKSFSEPFNINNKEIPITCSVGIAIYPQHGSNIETLLKNADIAMYQVKENGRNNYKFFTETFYDDIKLSWNG